MMEPSELVKAVEAGRTLASSIGLRVEEAVVVHNSNRIAVRLTPCDVLAKVAPHTFQVGEEFEVEVARRLAETGSPVVDLEPSAEPRVYSRDGFAITLWPYHESLDGASITPSEYACVLAELHAGLRQLDLKAPHFMDRVAGAQSAVADPEETPELRDADRDLLGKALSHLSSRTCGRGAREQLLHGEPHLGNLLRTWKGWLFIDLGTCCHGPIEFDLAHGLLPNEDGRSLAVEDVCQYYPGANHDLVRDCQILICAMITTWRWQRGDQLPNGRFWAVEGLRRLRVALDRHELDVQ